MSELHDPGCSVLDLLAACDGGQLMDIIDADLLDGVRHTLERVGSGRMKLTLDLTIEVLSPDEMLASLLTRWSWNSRNHASSTHHQRKRLDEIPVFAGAPDPSFGREPS